MCVCVIWRVLSDELYLFTHAVQSGFVSFKKDILRCLFTLQIEHSL